MLSAFTVPILEFLTIYDKKEATTVIESDKTSKVIIDETENQRRKKSKVHVIFAWLFLCINLILMSKTL